MRIPLELSFRGLSVPEEIESLCRLEAARLARFHGRLAACRVTVERSDRYHGRSDLFAVRIHLMLPGGALEVDREPPTDRLQESLRIALQDAFRATRRRLAEQRAKRRDLNQRRRPVRRGPGGRRPVRRSPIRAARAQPRRPRASAAP